MDNLWQDLRYGLRVLLRNRALTTVVVVSLALGIGANTAVFTVVKAVLLDSLPYQDSERLVTLYGTRNEGSGDTGFYPLSYPNYRDFARQSEAFSGLSAYTWLYFNLNGGDGKPERIMGQIVTGNYFDVLGAKPSLGRAFVAREDDVPGGHSLAVLSHGLWQRRFGGERGIVGSKIRLNGQDFTVIGVMPKSFRAPGTTYRIDLWVPMSVARTVLTPRDIFNERGQHWFNVIGRLVPGIGVEEATSRVEAAAAVLRRQHPVENEKWSVRLLPLREAHLDPNQQGAFRRTGALLMMAVGLVLLIATANAASLLLARAVIRSREVAVRQSVGAHPYRLLRQFLTESLLLSLLAGTVGILAALLSKDFLWSLRPPFIDGSTLDLGLDGRIVLFTLSISLLTGLLCGLAPALKAARLDLISSMKSRGGPAEQASSFRGFRGVLVACQIALCLVSMVGAGLLLQSLQRMKSSELGFNPENLLSLSFDPAAGGYSEARTRELYQRAVTQVRELPGVESVSLGENPLLGTPSFVFSVSAEGSSDPAAKDVFVQASAVGTDYFETLDMPLQSGRGFTQADKEDSRPVAIVNETLAKRFWPGESPVGRFIRFKTQPRPVEVVGVVPDAKYVSLNEQPQPYVYRPLLQHHASPVQLFVRTSIPPSRVVKSVEQELHRLDDTLALFDVHAVSDAVARSLWAPRMGAVLLSILALVAIVIAAVGVYSAMAFAVAQRRQEMGIRMALGAGKRDLIRLMFQKGFVSVGAGLLLGLCASLAFSRTLVGLLYQTDPIDWPTFSLAVLVLLAVTSIAIYIPSRRAALADPKELFRAD